MLGENINKISNIYHFSLDIFFTIFYVYAVPQMVLRKGGGL
jgi:hypothetical protein